MKRRTSMGEPLDSALDRSIESKYDVIASVAENVDKIESIGTAIQDGTLDNITNIVNMNVATGDAGTQAEWDGITLTVPRGDRGLRGDTGEDGLNGLTPNVEFSYNAGTGYIEATITGYTNVNAGDVLVVDTATGITSIVDDVVTEIETEEEW